MITKIRFIIIDDDLLNNKLSDIVIKMVSNELEVVTFNKPVNGLKFLESEYVVPHEEMRTVILLDINMPVWSGWDFLDHFESLGTGLKDQIEIYMLSSSIDTMDIKRARENANVIDYIAKPLTGEWVKSIVSTTDKPLESVVH